MNLSLVPHLAGPASPTLRQVIVGGAHRGALAGLSVFEDYNRDSAESLSPTFADVLPGRARALAAEATRRGVPSRAFEGRVEDLVRTPILPATAPVILHVDRASAIAGTLRAVRGQERAVLGYLVLRLPSGRLWGLRFVVEPGDEVTREGAELLFERIAAVSERGGADGIFGQGSDPADSLAEPVLRRSFTDHAKANLAKIVSGVEPAADPVEVCTIEGDAHPVFPHIAEAWGNPQTLGRAIVDSPSTPIRRGRDFVVAESTPAGIRFHDLRLRHDTRLAVRGAETLDLAAVEAALGRRDALVPAGRETSDGSLEALLAPLTAALSRAERITVSRSNPVRTTD